MRISDETLLAYVDGELDEIEKAQVDAAARTDAALARRIQAQKKLRDRMATVFADLVAETPPDRLMEAVKMQRPPAAVVDLSAVRQQRAKDSQPKRASNGWARWAAVAACLVLAVGVAYQIAPRLTPPVPAGAGAGMVGGPAGTLIAQGQLAGALDGQLASAGVKPGDAVRIGVSFHSTDGHYCRTFRVASGDGFSGLACRDSAGWRLRMTVANSAPEAHGATYRQAASDIPAPIAAAVQNLMDGAPLDAQQEAAGRAKGWKN